MSSDAIVVGPAEVWVADPGTAFPDIQAAPGAGWTLIGTDGALNYGESGVILRNEITEGQIQVLGSALARKRVISQRTFNVEFLLLDLSAEEMALAYGTDPADISTVAAGAGVAGEKSFAIDFSVVPLERAILVRVAQSASMGRLGNTDWRIARANYIGSAETTFNKTDGAGVSQVWAAIEPGGDEEAVVFAAQTTAPTA